VLGANERLRQGEIISGVIERLVRRLEGGEFGVDESVHPLAVLVSQDCDLEQDARLRGADRPSEEPANGLLANVLLLVAEEFASCGKPTFPGSDVKRNAKQNKLERFHYLCAIPPGFDLRSEGVPDLILDFKRVFTYPTEHLLEAIRTGEVHRRACLTTPYAEHLGVRFGHFLQRVGLPRDHHDVSPPEAT
jgi:hypothetical protein